MRRVLTIIVHHRGAEMLTLCLESLLDSREVETEIVVVNNGCEEELPSLVSESSRIHGVESATPLGFSEANNLGVAWARDRLEPALYLYFVNNDTLSEPAALALQVAALEEHPEAAVTGPRLVIWGAERYLNSLGLNVTRDAWGWDEGIGILARDYGELPGLRSVLAVTGSALLMRSEVFESVAGWSLLYDYYFEDIDLCLKARRAGFEILNVPDAVVRHGISVTMVEGSERKDFLFWRNRLLLGFAHWPLALWPELLGNAVGRDVFLAQEPLRALPRRALLEALRRFPSAWRLRCQSPRGPNSRDWVPQLSPTGSVPKITLPELCYRPLEERIQPRDKLWIPGSGGSLATQNEAALSDWKARPGRRMLVLGWSPLPFEEAQMNYAPGVRAWQLARSLAADGHQVFLVTAAMPGATRADQDSQEVLESLHDGVRILSMAWPRFEEEGWLQEIVDEFDPDGIVGATPLPARRACQIAGERPLWIDLFGDPMAEAQAKSSVSSGDHISAYRELLVELLGCGDLFSAVSERQKWAVIGQLGLQGRLNADTSGSSLVHSIPCSSESMGFSARGEIPQGVVPVDALVVLWSGGYNTWCDVDVLFDGLQRAMQEEPRLHFVSTGGAIEGHDEETYPKFQKMIEGSQFRDRFHLLGLRPKSEADAWVGRAQLGTVTERPLYERDLGSSQRVAGWLAAGLPFVCTGTSEIGELCDTLGIGYTYEIGDSSSFSEALLRALRGPDQLEAASRACRKWIEGEGSDAALTAPLRDWANSPHRSADASSINRDCTSPENAIALRLSQLREELTLYEAEVRRLFFLHRDAENKVKRLAPYEAEYHRVRSELGKIHESRMWKLWMVYLKLRGA